MACTLMPAAQGPYLQVSDITLRIGVGGRLVRFVRAALTAKVRVLAIITDVIRTKAFLRAERCTRCIHVPFNMSTATIPRCFLFTAGGASDAHCKSGGRPTHRRGPLASRQCKGGYGCRCHRRETSERQPWRTRPPRCYVRPRFEYFQKEQSDQEYKNSNTHRSHMEFPSWELAHLMPKRLHNVWEYGLYGKEGTGTAKDGHKQCCLGVIIFVVRPVPTFAHPKLRQWYPLFSFLLLEPDMRHLL